jgi:hypothetical protein
MEPAHHRAPGNVVVVSEAVRKGSGVAFQRRQPRDLAHGEDDELEAGNHRAHVRPQLLQASSGGPASQVSPLQRRPGQRSAQTSPATWAGRQAGRQQRNGGARRHGGGWLPVAATMALAAARGRTSRGPSWGRWLRSSETGRLSANARSSAACHIRSGPGAMAGVMPVACIQPAPSMMARQSKLASASLQRGSGAAESQGPCGKEHMHRRCQPPAAGLSFSMCACLTERRRSAAAEIRQCVAAVARRRRPLPPPPYALATPPPPPPPPTAG